MIGTEGQQSSAGIRIVSMQLFLIRHAQSQNNALPESRRIEDPGLTDLGCRQAERLGDWVPELRLTRLITSPFRRTLLTTEPIRQATALTPEVHSILHEQGGCYAGHEPGRLMGRPGMSREEIDREFPGYSIADEIGDQGWWASRPYETYDAARRRAAALLDWTRKRFADTEERVAYVMHADIKRLFLELIHDGPLDTPRNTSVTAVEVTPAGQSLQQFNQVAHLPADMLSW